MSNLATCRGCGQQYRDAYKLPDLLLHFQPIPFEEREIADLRTVGSTFGVCTPTPSSEG